MEAVIKEVFRTTETASFVKWLDDKGRWQKERITEKDYAAIATAPPNVAKGFSGKPEEWLQMWTDNKVIAISGRPLYETESGEVEPGTFEELEDGGLLIFTDNADNGLIVLLEPGEHTGSKTDKSATVELPLGITLEAGVLKWP